MISLQNALLCTSCDWVVDAATVRAEQCPKCAATGTLLSLSRVLNPSPRLGTITFILASGANDVLTDDQSVYDA